MNIQTKISPYMLTFGQDRAWVESRRCSHQLTSAPTTGKFRIVTLIVVICEYLCGLFTIKIVVTSEFTIVNPLPDEYMLNITITRKPLFTHSKSNDQHYVEKNFSAKITNLETDLRPKGWRGFNRTYPGKTILAS